MQKLKRKKKRVQCWMGTRDYKCCNRRRQRRVSIPVPHGCCASERALDASNVRECAERVCRESKEVEIFGLQQIRVSASLAIYYLVPAFIFQLQLPLPSSLPKPARPLPLRHPTSIYSAYGIYIPPTSVRRIFINKKKRIRLSGRFFKCLLWK
jgi:hypothetical protein